MNWFREGTSVAELVVSEERAIEIQTKLYPEHEWTGRPWRLAPDLAGIVKADRQRANADAKRAEETERQ